MGGHSITLTLEAGVKKDSGPYTLCIRDRLRKAQSVISITKLLLGSIGPGSASNQEEMMPSLSGTHERTDLKHHYGFILALVCMWLALAVASAIVLAAFA